MSLVLQEAFFGRPLLEKSQQDGGLVEMASDDDNSNPPSPAIKSTIYTKDPFEFPCSPVKPKPTPPKVQPPPTTTEAPTTSTESQPAISTGSMTKPSVSEPAVTPVTATSTEITTTPTPCDTSMTASASSDVIDDSDREHQIGECDLLSSSDVQCHELAHWHCGLLAIQLADFQLRL